jgi:hypothetical protein
MAVINQGMVPKAMAVGSGSYSPGSAAVGQGQRGQQARQPAARQSKPGSLLRAIKKAARNQLAGHNCGGTAFHDGSGMAHPVGRR